MEQETSKNSVRQVVLSGCLHFGAVVLLQYHRSVTMTVWCTRYYDMFRLARLLLCATACQQSYTDANRDSKISMSSNNWSDLFPCIIRPNVLLVANNAVLHVQISHSTTGSTAGRKLRRCVNVGMPAVQGRALPAAALKVVTGTVLQ